MSDYLRFLQLRNIDVEVRGPWGTSGHSPRHQGWKLHISAIPTNAYEILGTVSSVLQAQNVPFKFARHERVLRSLNEGGLGETQIGKFITVYPPSDDLSVSLADQLIQLTDRFEGPQIITDLQLGAVVYSRFGGFNPMHQRDRLGQVFTQITLPDGSTVRDGYSVPFSIPAGIKCPFPRALQSARTNQEHTSLPLFGPGYLLLDLLKQGPKGRVFLALDAREQREVCLRVIKEGRKLCLSDQSGRDIRTRLKRQEQLHRSLCRQLRVPNVEERFDIDGNVYLVLDHIPGRDFAALARTETPLRDERSEQLRVLVDLTAQVQQLHNLGYVHRDLSPSNIRVDKEGLVWLLDLELAHAIQDDDPPFSLGTPGFMSPQQEKGEEPSPSDDIFSIGCLALFLLSGIDPQQFMPGEERDRPARVRTLSNVTKRLSDVIAASLDEDPVKRPPLGVLTDSFAHEFAQPGTSYQESSCDSIAEIVTQAIPAALNGLFIDTYLDDATQLWLSPRGPITHRREYSEDFAIHRSTNRGVAGVVFVLARCARLGYRDERCTSAIVRAVDWLLTHEESPDDQLPGLHFGEAGVAVSLVEAVASGCITTGQWLDEYLQEALAGPLDWPDLTHGAAGQGLAALACSDLLEKPALSELAVRCADYLLQHQSERGAWELPKGVDGLAGVAFTGFAHGAAGILYFLVDYWKRCRDKSVERAWQRASEWLLRQAREGVDGSMRWPTREDGDDYWNWWCHGAPGIALAFLKLYEVTGELLYSKIAKAALMGPGAEPRHSNFTQCHGLSGLGEIALEGARILQDGCLLERAHSYARLLIALARRPHADTLIWCPESPAISTADLMVGGSGVLHFLLRVVAGGTVRAPLLV